MWIGSTAATAAAAGPRRRCREGTAGLLSVSLAHVVRLQQRKQQEQNRVD
jgi:hypothetical protein